MAVKTDYKMYNKQRREFSTSENNVCYKFDFSFFTGGNICKYASKMRERDILHCILEW